MLIQKIVTIINVSALLETELKVFKNNVVGINGPFLLLFLSYLLYNKVIFEKQLLNSFECNCRSAEVKE